MVVGLVQIDKTVESLREIIREVDEYISVRPAESSELERSRNGILRSLPGNYETNGAILGTLSQIVRFDRPLNYVELSQARLQSLKIDELRAHAKTVFQPEHTAWLIVGDLEKIEQPLRDANIAPVRVLTD